MGKNQALGKNNFVIDGFPRNKDNLEGWNKAMSEKVNLKMVLFFDCDDQVGNRRVVVVFCVEVMHCVSLGMC